MKNFLIALLLCLSAAAQTTTTNEMRMKAKTRPASIAGYYRIVVDSATGMLTCVKPDGTECLATGGGGGGAITLTMPSIFNVSGSPLTPPGTLAVSFNTASANQVLAGPTTGSPVIPSFRQLVTADLPALDVAKITTGTFGISRGGTGQSTMTDNAVLVGNNSGGYTQTPLCTGVVSYDTSTRVFTCGGAGATATLGANTFSGLQVIDLGTTPLVGLQLLTDPSIGTHFASSSTIKFTGSSNDGTAHQPTYRIYNDVQTNAGYSEFRLQYRLNDADGYTDKLNVSSDGRMALPKFATAGACIAGDYWVGTDTTLHKFRKCQDGALSDMDTSATGSGTGTVTSVGMTVPSALLAVTGSPVTVSGTLGLTLNTQVANSIFAGPSAGGSVTPTFRAMVPADVPTLNQNTSGSAGSLAANGSNCSAGNSPLGVDTLGNVEGCFDIATQTELNNHTTDGSAHGATASNTNNAIVMRNASGNFTAGTITAALTGNASTSTALATNGTNCSAGNYPLGVDAGGNAENCTVATGAGTVTSASTGNLTPLFTASVANPTTTPALSFSLSTAAAHTFFGNNTGSTAAPAFAQINVADVAGTFPIGQGGTGQTTATAGFDALSPNTTLGDIAYHNGTNNVRLAGNITTTKKFLRQTGNGSISATPAWDTLIAGDVPTLNQNTTGTAAALTANGTNCTAGNYARGVDASGNAENCTAAAGAGTVTDFTAGTLSPLFTTSVATSTTTPALSFTLSTAAAHTYLGNNTGSTAAPQYSSIVAADIPTLNQNTTGTAAALTSNGSNCSAGSYARGVDAAGAAENCTAVASDNGQVFYGYCVGAATSSTTIVMAPFGTANSGSCSSTTTTNELPMEWAGVIDVLRVKVNTGGVNGSSGVFTIYKNGSATAMTCTLGTGTTCNDTTHSASYAAGDTVGVRFTTQASETINSVRVSFWYH